MEVIPSLLADIEMDRGNDDLAQKLYQRALENSENESLSFEQKSSMSC